MTLGQYVKRLMGDASIYTTAQGAGVSNGGLHAIVRGQVERPTPDVLERLAIYFGKTDEEKRHVYAELMRLAGYFELMPEAAVLARSPYAGDLLAENELDAAVQELISDYTNPEAEEVWGFLDRFRREAPEDFRIYVSQRLAERRASQKGQR